ncbi:MAG: LEPR-XLL domain-containing protein, partial [Planctomycetota bacterium]
FEARDIERESQRCVVELDRIDGQGIELRRGAQEPPTPTNECTPGAVPEPRVLLAADPAGAGRIARTAACVATFAGARTVVDGLSIEPVIAMRAAFGPAASRSGAKRFAATGARDFAFR